LRSFFARVNGFDVTASLVGSRSWIFNLQQRQRESFSQHHDEDWKALFASQGMSSTMALLL